MKLSTIFLIFLLSLFIFSSCGDTEDKMEQLSSDKKITKFEVQGIRGLVTEVKKTISLTLPKGSDLTDIKPIIETSSKATVSPASGVSQDFTNPVSYTVTAEDLSTVDYIVSIANICVSEDKVYSFEFNNKRYEIIKDNKTWTAAAACAAERNGYLAEINNSAENNKIFDELKKAGIDLSKTVSGDGGAASYVWIGGNDIESEGKWVWNGNNDSNYIIFWEGGVDGKAVNNSFTNWGKEPDNYSNAQDGLALALTEWPKGSGSLGQAKQWNDLNVINSLYYVIEYD